MDTDEVVEAGKDDETSMLVDFNCPHCMNSVRMDILFTEKVDIYTITKLETSTRVH